MAQPFEVHTEFVGLVDGRNECKEVILRRRDQLSLLQLIKHGQKLRRLVVRHGFHQFFDDFGR